MGIAYNPSIVTNGLIFCVDAANPRSYPGSGTNWFQLSGSNNTGILTNGPTYNSSNLGSLSFDGVDDYVDFSANLGSMPAYTIMYWANRATGNRMPFAARTSTSFYWYGDNSWRYTHGGAGGEYYYPKTVSIPDNTWGCFCCAYDGANVNIYRNGVYEGQQATTGTADWSVGIRVGYWNGGAGYAWQGYISNVMMYNTALTATQVTQNFNALRGRYGV
jgi:hypothetical protein